MLALLLTFAVTHWELVSSNARTTVEKRAHGDGIHEFRVSTLTDVAGAWVADAYWHNEKHKPGTTLKTYRVLSQSDDEKVSYLQLHLPVIRDRDYTIRIQRYVNQASGLYQFTGRCVTDTGPPPNDQHVRVTECLAQLTIEPASGPLPTLVTYVAYANAAGSVPKWLVNVLAPKAATEVVDRLIELGRKRAAAGL